MSDELDLERGDADKAERLQAEGQAARGARRSPRKPRGTGSSKSSSTKESAEKKQPDVTLVTRITGGFQDLAKQFEARGDIELATILETRAGAMAHGLESLTRSVKWLRGPLVFFISFLEPVLAFWELGSLLATRYVNRRARKAMERQYRDAGMTPPPDVEAVA